MKKRELLLNCLLFVTTVCNCQTFEIYKDDPLFNHIKDTADKNTFFGSFKSREKMPSGTYIVYSTKRKDKKKLILFKGQYQDSLKTGNFYYFDPYSGKLVKKERYQNGRLNGELVEYENGKVIMRGFYQEGKQHGILISCEPNGVVRSSSFFRGDTLLYTISYTKDSPYYVYELLRDSRSKHTYYDTNAFKTAVFEYCSSKLCRVMEYYPNGVLKSDKEGVFQTQKENMQMLHTVILKTPLIEGTEKHFNTEGVLVNEVKVNKN